MNLGAAPPKEFCFAGLAIAANVSGVYDVESANTN